MSVATDRNGFAGKRVLVSGGTKGLGRATTERFLTGHGSDCGTFRGNTGEKNGNKSRQPMADQVPLQRSTPTIAIASRSY